MLRRCLVVFRIAVTGVLVLAFAPESQGVTIHSILDIGQSADVGGAIFEAEPNPTSPSTGTGVFQPFVRIQANGSSEVLSSPLGNGNANKKVGNGNNTNLQNGDSDLQLGFNTDAKEPGINFDTKGGKWTHSITLGDVGTVAREGQRYFEFALDANEPGRAGSDANLIDITDVQLFVGPGLALPESSGFALTNGVLDLGPDGHLVWQLPSDHIVRLSASICDAPGQCGSGHGDMTLLIPVENLPNGWSRTDNVVLFTRYGQAGSGFEEWRHGTDNPIPEPRAVLAFTAGALVVGWATRRARR